MRVVNLDMIHRTWFWRIQSRLRVNLRANVAGGWKEVDPEVFILLLLDHGNPAVMHGAKANTRRQCRAKMTRKSWRGLFTGYTWT